MAQHVCPIWVGYLLLNPIRRLMENPDKLFRPFVKERMTVLEPGCGMGFFTLPLARMVGPQGKVIVVEIQQKMLDALKRRAKRAGVHDRIDVRLAESNGLGTEDMTGQVDFAAAMHMVHEMPDRDLFFRETLRALKPGGRLLVIEPPGHVSKEQFEKTIAVATASGFDIDKDAEKVNRRGAVLVKNAS